MDKSNSNNATENTVKLHRVFKAPANILYRAFLEPAALCKWMAPHGFVGEVQHSDIREGGSYRMTFTNFRSGQSHAFGGKYKELKPDELIHYTDKFEDPNMPGEILVTINLRTVLCGTEVNIIQENLPSQIPVEMCYLGWQESLSLLALLVEPDIK